MVQAIYLIVVIIIAFIVLMAIIASVQTRAEEYGTTIRHEVGRIILIILGIIALFFIGALVLHVFEGHEGIFYLFGKISQ